MNEIVCVPLWEGWLRLALQPLLILWAWLHRIERDDTFSKDVTLSNFEMRWLFPLS